MNPNEPDAYLNKARWIWFILLTVVLWVWILDLNNAPDAGLATKLRFFPRLLIALAASYFAAKYIAPIQLKIHEDMNEKADESKRRSIQKEAQKAHQRMIQKFDEESKTQQNLTRASTSKYEVVKRLATIDQFIRAYEGETNSGQRTMALQDAHSAIMALSARLASGEISRDALDDHEIRLLAYETCMDLERIGLSEDRLNRDIKRMFKLDAE